MDFSQLECFVRSYETGSFSKAAAELYLAQPSLAYRIASLEKELGCELFSRSKRGIAPTAVADAIYEEAKSLLASQSRLVDAARRAHGESPASVRVGFNRYPNVPMFFEAIETFRAERPGLDISLDFGYLDDPEAALAAGTHDVVFQLDYDRKDYAPLTFVALGTATFYAVMSESNPLAACATLKLRDLAGQTFLTLKKLARSKYQVPSLDELALAGVEIDDSFVDNDLLVLAIKTNRGVSAYPACGAQTIGGLVRRPLVDVEPLGFGLLFSRKRLNPAARAFIDAVVAHMGNASV